MVNEKVIMSTVKKMKASGLEDEVIVSTLLDIGLSEGEAQAFLGKISRGEKPTAKEPAVQPSAEEKEETPAAGKSEKTAPDEGKEKEEPLEIKEETIEEPEEKEEHRAIAEKTAARIKEEIDAHAMEHAFYQEKTDASLEEHKNVLEEVHSKISALHEQPASSEVLKELKVLNAELSTLKESLSEAKAMSAATKELMEKILEVNRKILSKTV